MWLDGIGFAAPLEDQTKSRVVGKVGYGVVPPGPKAQHSAIFGDGMGISAHLEQEGRLLALHPVDDQQGEPARTCCKAGAGAPARNSPFDDTETIRASTFGKQWFDCDPRLGQDRPARPAGHHPGDRVPRHLRRGADQHDHRRRSEDRAREGDRTLQAGAREERAGLSSAHIDERRCVRSVERARRRAPQRAVRRRRRRAWSTARATGCSSLPATVVVAAVIVFPWLFTLCMSVHDWNVSGDRRPSSGSTTTGSCSPTSAFSSRSAHALLHACWRSCSRSCSASAAALVFHREFPGRGVLRAHLHHADDGDAGRGRAGVDHDVPPAARRAQLSALAASACRPRLGLRARRP